MIHIIGENPLKINADGTPHVRIATAFPRALTLVTLPGIHCSQRIAFTDELNEQRRRAGRPELTDAEQTELWDQSVDLIVEADAILIRPDPDFMPLAYEADEMLQELVSKRKIKFLHVLNEKVRQEIQRRGEAWRIHPLPKSADEMRKMVTGSRIGIGGRPIYYYNATSGTRWLTCQEFCALGKLDNAQLRQHLIEIANHGACRNVSGHVEIDFFKAGRSFGASDCCAADLQNLPDEEMRVVFETWCRKFKNAVPPDLRDDDIDNTTWRNHMYCALVDQRDDVISEEALLGLSSEFFMRVQWLPGARLEEGELIFDSVFNEPDASRDPQIVAWGDTCRGLICNLMQEFGDLEYVNIGRVFGSLAQNAPMRGRRDVFIAQIKQRVAPAEMLKIIRMQKYGVREKLDEGEDLLRAMIECEEYTEYILDRRLGCRQIGMNLTPRASTRKLTERYFGRQKQLEGITIWSPYFQRDYLRGVASDKLPAGKLADPRYALALATLLGKAAAPNLIAGRTDVDGEVIFDDGDEIIIENAQGLPVDIVVADHTGTFGRFRETLCELAPAYARVVTRRLAQLPDPDAFSQAYLTGFIQRFEQIQVEYARRKRAFDTLFKHRRRDPAGNFRFRWECTLDRLSESNATEVANCIRHAIPSAVHSAATA